MGGAQSKKVAKDPSMGVVGSKPKKSQTPPWREEPPSDCGIRNVPESLLVELFSNDVLVFLLPTCKYFYIFVFEHLKQHFKEESPDRKWICFYKKEIWTSYDDEPNPEESGFGRFSQARAVRWPQRARVHPEYPAGGYSMSDFPFGATPKHIHGDKWDSETVESQHTLVPPNCAKDSVFDTFDTRHQSILLALGRYCLVPNMHAYTVTDGRKLLEYKPDLASIRCHFFICEQDQQLSNLRSLDMNFCVDDAYTVVCPDLSSAVYQCGKAYTTFSCKDRGLKYFDATKFPNLVALKLSYPDVAWTDMSGMGGTLPLYNFEGWSCLDALPNLNVFIEERLEVNRQTGVLTLRCYRRNPNPPKPDKKKK